MFLGTLTAFFNFLIFFATWTHAQKSSAPDCQRLGGAQEALLITPDCVDPEYRSPIINGETNETSPAPHYRVTGYFENTTIRFNYYFPHRNSTPEQAWGRRFFQAVYPTQDENASEETISHALDFNAYVVQTTGTLGYRAEAASAKFSRIVAREFYGLDNTTETPIFGYVYGASGGALQVIGAMENTVGVWNGGVPMVQAITASVGITNTMRAMMGLVLHNKSNGIETALKPGGSGDPFGSLNDVQQGILQELVQLGAPIEALEDFAATANRTGLAQLGGSLTALDTTYVEDFWTKPGYLGSEKSALGDLFRDAVVEFNATVLDVVKNDQGVPIAVSLGDIPATEALSYDWDTIGYSFTVTSKEGTTPGNLLGRFNSTISIATFSVVEAAGNDNSFYSYIRPKAVVQISNKDFIAMHAWYRYQVPPISEDRGYIGYEQFRTANGSSIYPQRSVIVPPILARSAAGGASLSGSIKGKMIVLQNLMDVDALPWWAHWYRKEVAQSMAEAFADNYRLWYNTHAAHDPGPRPKDDQAHLVDYTSIFEYALRDVSAWVEKQIAPTMSTRYAITQDNGVEIPRAASLRGGVQPTVYLSLSRASEDSTSQKIIFTAVAEAPPGTGKIVSFEWDFYGRGDFTLQEVQHPAESVTEQMEFIYKESGMYVAVVKATSQRDGNAKSVYARVSNLGRAAVTVT